MKDLEKIKEQLKEIFEKLGFNHQHDPMVHKDIFDKIHGLYTIRIEEKTLGTYANDLTYIPNCYECSINKYITKGEYDYKANVFGFYKKRYITKNSFFKLAQIDAFIYNEIDIKQVIAGLLTIVKFDNNENSYKTFPGFNDELDIMQNGNKQ